MMYINMAKVAGILVEVEGTVADEVHTIIGVGLNVDLVENLDLAKPIQAHSIMLKIRLNAMNWLLIY